MRVAQPFIADDLHGLCDHLRYLGSVQDIRADGVGQLVPVYGLKKGDVGKGVARIEVSGPHVTLRLRCAGHARTADVLRFTSIPDSSHAPDEDKMRARRHCFGVAEQWRRKTPATTACRPATGGRQWTVVASGYMALDVESIAPLLDDAARAEAQRRLYRTVRQLFRW